ncbi:hypothetical protein [Emcibacter nanhaiensis]|uniref:Uncharacterized protein n=1 Tax=Emcibacter nanhaiensis TaxID=1505037 RepID=A0A501PBQ0_9PROT|nr:hypothetical protein [Emcibacter nanhaiensis]TPD57294.1 hypothetical protein FIV46_14290 [Emcibacter nanhaiensis]
MVRATKGNFEYRVDSQPSVTVLMRPSKTLLFKNDYESPFVKALLEGKETVIIRLTDYEFEKSTAKFTLNGAKEAISKVMGSCHK